MKKACIVLLAAAVFLCGAVGVYAETLDPFDYARTVYEYILENYYGEIDEELLAENLIKAIAETLDVYSMYMTIDEADTFFENLSGEYVGIGISFMISEDGARIVSVLRGTPAKKAGILPGDYIISVDGTFVHGLSSDEIGSLIRGEAGGQVTLLISREGSAQLLEFVVTREEIVIDPVFYSIIDDDTGYLEISTFNSRTYIQAEEALSFFSRRGINDIVLDLRNNGGGLVSQAVMVAGLFVPEGNVTTLDFENPDYPDLTYVSTLKEPKFDLVVLVNENTASASELLAAAIQERSAGKIVGSVTFGKGIFQTGQYMASYLFFLENYEEAGVKAVFTSQFDALGILLSEDDMGGYFHLTSGRYLTPEGNDINGIGVIPDITVAESAETSQIRNIDRTADYFNYDAGPDEVVRLNAKAILKLLGFYAGAADTELTEGFTDAVGDFQETNGLVRTEELNYITCRLLDRFLEELSVGKDEQLKEAIYQLDYDSIS